MAPLVTPGGEFDLLWAFIIGTGFGFVLERAGFSTSRIIIGSFYGYDFTVIKVFFTTAITAATGLLLLNHMGYLDFGSIYIPSTFLWPTIVGGAFMAFGFIIGGFCPGTSVCAASIGKLDALAFIGGLVIGIFFYSLSYETLWMELRASSNLGILQMSDLLGISMGAFVTIFSIIAVIVFIITSKIQSNVEKVEY